MRSIISSAPLLVLEGATGLRISEALALEAKHFINDRRTIVVRQQVDREAPRIVDYVKTDAAFREVDLYAPVAEYLRTFIDSKDGLLFKTRNGTPHLYNNLGDRWLANTTVKSIGIGDAGCRLAHVQEIPKDMVERQALPRRREQFLAGAQTESDVGTL